eukprot:UN24426
MEIEKENVKIDYNAQISEIKKKETGLNESLEKLSSENRELNTRVKQQEESKNGTLEYIKQQTEQIKELQRLLTQKDSEMQHHKNQSAEYEMKLNQEIADKVLLEESTHKINELENKLSEIQK